MQKSATVIDAKAAFIRTQVRLLSTPLEPSTSWRDLAPESEEGDLSDKITQDVLKKVNEKVKQHNRSVFSVQSQRHVAEQIDTLYWNTVTEETAQVGLETIGVKKAADLTTLETIQSLPEECEDLHLHPGQDVEEEDKARYEELQKRLQILVVKRDQQQAKLAQYRQLQMLLKPFENAQENIQPNLVTRDGELSKELDRMRMLLARVTGRLSEIQSTNESVKTWRPAAPTNEQRLANVMDLT